jgi:peptide/nickel transport system substrate-binding protein
MKRRSFLGIVAAGAGTLAAPRLGRGAAASTLRFVPAQDLTLLDPIQSPSGSTIMHSCLVFDTLYGLDESYKSQPQMVEGHAIEDDGKTWKIKLRDGLKFHNGEPVRARDVVASLQRWGKRDTFGQTLFSVTDELSAPSDKVVQFRLKKPFPMIPDALGKTGAFFAIIVPEHLAQTDPTKGMPEIIGSDPYRYVPDERVQGSLNVYAKFTDYIPRSSGTPSFLAVPKIANFDRVEWQTIRIPRRRRPRCRRARWTGGTRQPPTRCLCSARMPASWSACAPPSLHLACCGRTRRSPRSATRRSDAR